MVDARELGTIAVIGGTGAEGSGLAWRWARAGMDVIIGSRAADKGANAAVELNARLAGGAVAGAAGGAVAGAAGGAVRGTDNLSAAQQAAIVVLSVPYESQAAILATIQPALAGKTLVTIVAPLLGEKKGRYTPPPGGSAALEVQAQVGDGVTLVAAFQNVGAHHLADVEHSIECDVLVCAETREARETGIALAQAAGLRGVHAGVLANTAVVEGLTAVLIAVNAAYKVRSAGIRITGLPRP